MNGPTAVFVAIAFFSATAYSIKAIASAIVRYRENELKYANTAVGSSSEMRLERIEQAVDAIAIEIERISEGQRFTTRLLSDRTSHSIS